MQLPVYPNIARSDSITQKTDNGLKHPATLYFPFHEKFGLMLLRFLNADLSNFESANQSFFMLMVLRY